MATRDQQKRQTRQAFFIAVLDVCMSGQAFSSLSLRQITREVGVVPTAFYRHFSDMDELGNCLVEEHLGTALAQLRTHLHVGKKRAFARQIAISVELFFKAIDKQPSYWQFIVTERYGGNASVQRALNQQIRLFIRLLSEDLGLQPAFGHLPQEVRLLIADMGVNLFFSWVYDWLVLTHQTPPNNSKILAEDAAISATSQAILLSCELDDTPMTLDNLEAIKSAYLKRCTRQAQLLFYGVSNWREPPL